MMHGAILDDLQQCQRIASFGPDEEAYPTAQLRPAANRWRSSILTDRRASNAVAPRSTLVASARTEIAEKKALTSERPYRLVFQKPSMLLSTYMHQQRLPSRYVKERGGLTYRSTHKHHLHPSFSPGNPGRCVMRSFPTLQHLWEPGEEKLTPLLAELEELFGDYPANEMLAWILVSAPAVSIAEKASRVRRVRRGGQRLQRSVKNCEMSEGYRGESDTPFSLLDSTTIVLAPLVRLNGVLRLNREVILRGIDTRFLRFTSTIR